MKYVTIPLKTKCLKTLFTTFFLGLSVSSVLLLTGCASSDDKKSDSSSKKKSKAEKAEAMADDSPSEKRSTPLTTGRAALVTTTLGNENTLEGSIPGQILSEVLLSLDELARKEPDNVPVLVTYLGLLRLHGQSPDLYLSIERRAGLHGAKNVWFTLEAGYGAMRRKEFALADYLFNKAEKNAAGNPTAKAAVNHAFGVKALLSGKTQEGIAVMRKAASAEPPFLPSLLTLGFLGLRSGDFAGAERNFRAATASFPNSLNARLGLGASLRARGKVDEAIPLVQGIYKTRPTDRRLAWNYALTLSDNPSTVREAQAVLAKYFELPGQLPDIDAKANALANKLQSMTPATPAARAPAAGAPPAAKPPAAGGAAPKK